jgi:hypothetical protein
MEKMHLHEQDYIETAQVLYDAYATPTSENLLSELLMDTLNYPAEYENSGLSARAFLNSFVLRYYPNEMVVKTNFVNNVLLKQGKTNVSIFELSIGESRIDICKINGCSAAFEIKTDLDSFVRLKKQLSDYYDVFEYVSVIISEGRWQTLPDFVPDYCGIYSYHQRKDGQYSFRLRRAPVKQSMFDSRKQLSIMPKSVLTRKMGAACTMPVSEIVNRCLAAHSKDEVNRFFKCYLKRRYEKRWEFLKEHNSDIYEIDYEWFFRNNLNPNVIY